MTEPLTICTYLWKPKPGYRSQFSAVHVNILAQAVRKHYRRPHRFVCITDDDTGIHEDIGIVPLWSDLGGLPSPHGPGYPSCYRRLRAFAADAATLIGPRFVTLDLDVVVTGDLAPIFDRPEPIVLLEGWHPTNHYNGSLVLQSAGARPQVWDRFDPVESPKAARAANQFGSDQGWLGACLGPGEAKFTTADGVYSFRKHCLPKGGALPEGARLVFFHGDIDPDHPKAQRLDWVREHWG